MAAQPATAARGPAFEYAYRPPSALDLQPIYRRVVEADLWRQLPELEELDGLFVLPRRLRLVTAECGEPGAFYRPAPGEVVLCYESLRTLYAQGQAHRQALGLGEDHPLRYVRANVRFMVLHELGHALVDLFDLPVTGRQEDAVDQLAAILMLRFGGRDESPGEVILYQGRSFKSYRGMGSLGAMARDEQSNLTYRVRLGPGAQQGDGVEARGVVHVANPSGVDLETRPDNGMFVNCP